MKIETDRPRQRQLPFNEAYDRARETRAERIERLLSKAPVQLTTGARMFDFAEASRIAVGTTLGFGPLHTRKSR